MKIPEDNVFFWEDTDIKIRIGSLVINVFYISYIPPGCESNYDYHCHSSYELHLIPKGSGTLFVGKTKDKIYEIQPGSLYVTGPGIYHKQTTAAYDPMAEYGLNFEIEESTHRQNGYEKTPEGEVQFIKDTLRSTMFWIGTDAYNTRSLFDLLFKEIDENKAGAYTCIRNYIGTILINTIRNYSGTAEMNYALPRKTLDDKRRIMIDNFFREYRQDLTIDSLAEKTGFSTRHLSRVLRKYYGMSFKEKLMHTRIDISRLLLRNTDYSISEIADLTGFFNVSYFSTLFKKLTGVSPKKYRSGYKDRQEHRVRQ